MLKVNKAIESSQKNEIRLKSFNDELAVRISDLQSQLVNEKKEREKLQLEMDHTAVELRKAKAQISNLNDKCKVCQLTHPSLIYSDNYLLFFTIEFIVRAEKFGCSY